MQRDTCHQPAYLDCPGKPFGRIVLHQSVLARIDVADSDACHFAGERHIDIGSDQRFVASSFTGQIIEAILFQLFKCCHATEIPVQFRPQHQQVECLVGSDHQGNFQCRPIVDRCRGIAQFLRFAVDGAVGIELEEPQVM